MPQRYTHLDDGGVLRISEGVLTFADVAAVNRDLYASPEAIRAIAYQISDYSAVDRVDVTSDEVRALSKADQDAALGNPDMLIAVVGQSDIMFGLLRMWDLYTIQSPFKSSVFRDVVEAQEWIRSQRQGRSG